MKRVFLSSSAEHWQTSHRLVSALELSGVNVWNGFHDELQELHNYADLVRNQILSCDAVLALLPDRSQTHVENEVRLSPKSALKIAVVVGDIVSSTEKSPVWADEVIDLRGNIELEKQPDFQRLVQLLLPGHSGITELSRDHFDVLRDLDALLAELSEHFRKINDPDRLAKDMRFVRASADSMRSFIESFDGAEAVEIPTSLPNGLLERLRSIDLKGVDGLAGIAQKIADAISKLF
ncbi:MAG: hypothetical protein AAFQ58_23965 [Pseudomonadota bacterium]